MKKFLFCTLVLCLVNSAFAARPKVSWDGYIQGGVESGEGTSNPSEGREKGSDVKFSVANMRLRLKAFRDSASSNQTSSLFFQLGSKGKEVTLLDGILSYQFSDSTKFQIGKFKVPTGMDWHVDDKDLDIIDRSDLTMMLNHGRNTGVMASGDIMDNLSYSIGHFNSGASPQGNGKDHLTAARLMLNHGDLHLQLSFAQDENKKVYYVEDKNDKPLFMHTQHRGQSQSSSPPSTVRKTPSKPMV